MSPYVAKGIKVVDGIKIAKRLTLKWRDYSELTRGDDVIMNVLEMGRGWKRRRPGRHNIRRTLPAVAGFADGGRGPRPRSLAP